MPGTGCRRDCMEVHAGQALDIYSELDLCQMLAACSTHVDETDRKTLLGIRRRAHPDRGIARLSDEDA